MENVWCPTIISSSAYAIISVGIFGYLNYLQPRTRQYILEALVKGLQRLEYRGYDSAGVAFDSDVQVNHDAQNLQQTTWEDMYVWMSLCTYRIAGNFGKR